MKKILTLLATAAMMLSLLAGCGSPQEDPLQSDGSSAIEDSQPVEDPVEDEGTDPRGIPGMDSFALKMVMSSPPVNIPMAENTPAESEAAEIYAYSCIGIGTSSDGSVSYDYSMTLDSDKEIIGASFGVASTGASSDMLLNAADLYFFSVGILEYDGADPDALTDWLTENLPNASTDPLTTTIGPATFELYYDGSSMYFLDIKKAE